MADHSHQFVETYKGLVGFGFDRETDEKTVMWYLQKFSDDAFMEKLIPRMTDKDLEDIFMLLNRVLKQHMAEAEYHQLFLKDDHH